jgi:predicted MFS family arabinose efflux permease
VTRRSVVLVLVAAAAIFALTLGIRTSLALFISAINTKTGLGLVAISFAFAVSQLTWGVAQPFAGALADRYGAGRVLGVGILMVGAGTALTVIAGTTPALVFTIGVLVAIGAGAAGPGILLAAVQRLVPPEKRGIGAGMVTAGGSLGQLTVVPLAQGLIGWAGGWTTALLWLGGLAAAAIPLAWILRGKSEAPAAGAAPHEPFGAALKRAFGDSNYGLLNAGFFTCGFHVAFISTHLPGVVDSCQLPASVGAWSLAVIGLGNMVGSFAIGWSMNRWRSKSLLALVYAMRAVAVAVFLVAPKTELTFLLFALVLGVSWLSTVPPTAGLVAKFYGPRYMATLFGIVMLSHQIGGFLGAYLGGVAFEATGSYDWMWYADIALALFAAAVHLPIREKPVRAVPVPA